MCSTKPGSTRFCSNSKSQPISSGRTTQGLSRAGKPFRHKFCHGFDYLPIMFAEGAPGDQGLDRVFEHNHLAVGMNYGRILIVDKELLEPEALGRVVNHSPDVLLDVQLVGTVQLTFR